MLLLLACSAPDTGKTGDAEAWVLRTGGAGADEAWGLAAVGDGDVLALAHESDGLPDLVLRRLTAEGDVVWETTWGDDQSQLGYVVEVANGVAYVGGSTFHGLATADADALVVAFDVATGDALWSWTADPSGAYEEVDDVIVDGDQLLLEGWAGSTGVGGDNDVLVGALDLDGTERWLLTDGGDGWDEANGHAALLDGTLYVAGLRDGSGYAIGGTACVRAYDAASGELLGSTDLAPDADYSDALGLTTDGEGLYVIGAENVDGDAQLGLWSVDPAGSLRWATDWGADGSEFGRALSWDGGLLAAVNVDGDGRDLALLRIDAADGTVTASSTWSEPEDQAAHEVLADGDGVYVAGQETVGLDDTALFVRVPAATLTWPE